MANELYTNNASTTLTANYTAGAGSIQVGSTAGNFPTSAVFRVSIFDSSDVLKVILKVTAITDATHFAVTAEGTDANAASGDTVRLVLTAGAMDGIRADVSQSGTDASIPSVTNQKAGNLYFAQDKPYLYRFNGSAFSKFQSGVLASVFISTAQGTTSTSYVDLATPDSITFTLDFAIPVLITYSTLTVNTGVTENYSIVNVDSSDVSASEFTHSITNANFQLPHGFSYPVGSLAAGSHTIKIRHKVGANTGTWKTRCLFAMAAPA